MLEEMLDLGLKKGQTWPNHIYKDVAANIALRNPNVTTKYMLVRIVQAVLKVPPNKIENVDYETMRRSYNLPNVSLLG